jgi:hypothetical protein
MREVTEEDELIIEKADEKVRASPRIDAYPSVSSIFLLTQI